jgi:dolichyl-phosphate-mannose-protein mannosyltransferase
MSMRRVLLDSLLIVIVGVIMFARVSTAYFCGFDDFGETHRAVFEDARHPVHIFTTTHFGGPKYRPLNRLSTFVCWELGGGSALPFRLRNLFFHLICAFCVYGIAWFWTHDRKTALTAGLLFCLMPAANQTVVAAIFTNTVAYALLLASFLLFLYWLDRGRWYILAASMTSVSIGLFFYEPVIVVFAMIFGYLFLSSWKRNTLDGRKIMALVGSSAVVLLIFGTVRHLIVHGQNPRAPLGTILVDSAMYIAALVSPVDPVLANRLFGTPLPPAFHVSRQSLLWLALAFAALLATALLLLRTQAVQAGLRRLDKGLAAFLVFSIFAVLTPFLVFSPHASETYLYLPAALYAIVLSLVFRALLTSDLAYGIVAAIFLLSFGAGTWARNQKVAACGQIAARILGQLPMDDWKTGESYIRLANAAGEAPQHHYGVYLYQGLSTIERGDPGDSPAAMYALQLVTKNPSLKVEVVDPTEMDHSCSIPRTCFWVYRDGTIRDVTQTAAK